MQETNAISARLLQVTGLGLVQMLRVFEQPQLHGVITVGCGRLALRHDTRPCLYQRDRNYLSFCCKDLRHAEFFAENSWTHSLIPSGFLDVHFDLPKALIST